MLEKISDTIFFRNLFSGKLGREILGHSLPLLARLLEDRTSRLRAQLSSIVSQPETLKISGNMSLENLYEDLHWIILLATHVLCMESEGEVATMPSEIMRYSMKQVKNNKNLTYTVYKKNYNKYF